MSIVLLGRDGQIGQQLQRTLTRLANVGPVIALGRAEADFSQPQQTLAAVTRYQPKIIVNAAAYTAVDQAEHESALAHCINATTPGLLAQWAAQHGALLVHYSSDYVFDGRGQRPWREDATPAPLSAYGRSKLAGDTLIAQAGGAHLILRTSWVHAAQGHNFIHTILRLAQAQTCLQVVNDQWGAPTSAAWLAEVTAQALAHLLAHPQAAGLYHCSAAGQTSWFDYAETILALARQTRFAPKIQACRVLALSSASRPTTAQRPHNSCLDTGKLQTTFGITPPPWQAGVAQSLADILEKTVL